MIFKDVGAGIWVFTKYIPDTRSRLRNRVGLGIRMYSMKIEIHIYLRDAWAQRFGFYWIEALHTFTFAFPTAKFKAVQRALETLNNKHCLLLLSLPLFHFLESERKNGKRRNGSKSSSTVCCFGFYYYSAFCIWLLNKFIYKALPPHSFPLSSLSFSMFWRHFCCLLLLFSLFLPIPFAIVVVFDWAFFMQIFVMKLSGALISIWFYFSPV